MKILINQKTYDKILAKAPKTNNIFTLINFVKDLYNNLEIEIDETLEDNNVKIIDKEEE